MEYGSKERVHGPQTAMNVFKLLLPPLAGAAAERMKGRRVR